jgi:hypothetical protein
MLRGAPLHLNSLEQNDGQELEGGKENNPAAWPDDKLLNNLTEFSHRQASAEFEQEEVKNYEDNGQAPDTPLTKRLFPDQNGQTSPPNDEAEKAPPLIIDKNGKATWEIPKKREMPELSRENRKTLKTLEMLTHIGDFAKNDLSSTMLRHYLYGNGEPVFLPDTKALRDYKPIKGAEVKIEGKYYELFNGDNNKPLKDGLADFMKSGEKEWVIRDIGTSVTFGQKSQTTASDVGSAVGSGTIQARMDVHLRREGDEIHMTGEVRQYLEDKYDFGFTDKYGNPQNEWLPHGVPALDFTLDRARCQELENSGAVKPFEVKSGIWRRSVEGTLHVDNEATTVSSLEFN